MTPDLPRISFGTLPKDLSSESYVAHVPSRLTSRAMLFDALRKNLRLPDYFGGNWDALSDCLRDLSWIEQRRVVIVHDDVPALDAKSLATYVDVLGECVADWKSNDMHELFVVFPTDARAALAACLSPDRQV